MIIRLNVRWLSWIALVVVVILIALYFLFYYGQSSQPTVTELPADVAHALEYFNALNSNKTILVPSEYYSLATAYSINGNKVISNETEYANILLKNENFSNVNFVLIDIGQLNFLQSLYYYAGISLNYSIIPFPISYTITNLSTNAKNCYDYKNATAGFAFCQFFVLGRRFGNITIANFPASSTLYSINASPINASVYYNGKNMFYLPSDVTSNSTGLKHGVIFVYEGLVNLYLPSQLMSTFYGEHMFLPNSTTNNVFDSFGEARVVALH